MKPKFIQKNIRFPSTVIEVLEKDGERFGFNFNEYVKYLVVKKVEELEVEDLVLSKDEIAEIKESLEEVKKDKDHKKFPLLSTDKEIKDYLNQILKEDG